MIDSYDPPAPNNHLCVISALIVGDLSITNVGEGEGCIELDSHVNMCVLRKQCYIT